MTFDLKLQLFPHVLSHPTTYHSIGFRTCQLAEMVQCWTASCGAWPRGMTASWVMAGARPEVKRCMTLPDIQNTPKPQ